MALVAKIFLTSCTWYPSGSQYDPQASGQTGPQYAARSFPNGFPNQLSQSSSWEGSKLDPDFTNVYHLNEADITEVELALASFKGMCLENGIND
jgi:hypothetical protein